MQYTQKGRMGGWREAVEGVGGMRQGTGVGRGRGIRVQVSVSLSLVIGSTFTTCLLLIRCCVRKGSLLIYPVHFFPVFFFFSSPLFIFLLLCQCYHYHHLYQQRYAMYYVLRILGSFHQRTLFLLPSFSSSERSTNSACQCESRRKEWRDMLRCGSDVICLRVGVITHPSLPLVLIDNPLSPPFQVSRRWTRVAVHLFPWQLLICCLHTSTEMLLLASPAAAESLVQRQARVLSQRGSRQLTCFGHHLTRSKSIPSRPATVMTLLDCLFCLDLSY